MIKVRLLRQSYYKGDSTLSKRFCTDSEVARNRLRGFLSLSTNFWWLTEIIAHILLIRKKESSNALPPILLGQPAQTNFWWVLGVCGYERGRYRDFLKCNWHKTQSCNKDSLNSILTLFPQPDFWKFGLPLLLPPAYQPPLRQQQPAHTVTSKWWLIASNPI